MITVAWGRPARWLLPLAVVLAVLVMHHLPAGHDPISSSVTMGTHQCRMAPSASDGAPMAAMGHECLAVMSKVVLLVASTGCVALGLPRCDRPPDRPPGRSGRATLHSVCVLRL